MAVPDTNTFSLSDVITELNLADDEGLQECFDDAVDSEFDPSYEGSKDRLSNFRNYGAGPVWRSFSTTTFPGISGSTGDKACAVSKPNTLYYFGTDPDFIAGGDPISSTNGSQTNVGTGWWFTDLQYGLNVEVGIVNGVSTPISNSYCFIP